MRRKPMLLAFAMLALTAAVPTRMTQAADEPADGQTLLERYVTALNSHNPEAFKDIIAEDYIQHNGRAGQGLAGLQGTVQQYFQTFTDFHAQLEDSIVAGNKVVARFTLTATHDHTVQLGPGAPVFPPTGKKLRWEGISIWRVADGKFVEHWDEDDLLGLSRQMRSN